MTGYDAPRTFGSRTTALEASLRRSSIALALAVPLLALHPAPARAQTAILQPNIRLHADRITFYYDRFLVEADGHVRVDAGNGVTMTGQTFSMDLKLDRFLLAGTVHVTSPSGTQDGAALADFLSFGRVYFLPILREDPAAGSGAGAYRIVPDRWTFLGTDFAHPIKGREMPGDTFDFPNLVGAKPFLFASSATIGPGSFARFGPGRVDVIDQAGVYAPVPSFYVGFSPDPHLGENSLSGANFDATYNFAGGAHAISALHLRYDTVNKFYYSIEQHVSGKKGFAVFSVNPLSRPSKFWNLLTGYAPDPTLQARTFTQLHTYQSGFSQPVEAEQVTTVQLTKALKESFVQTNYQFTNFSLLPPTPKGYYGTDPSRGLVLRDPSSLQVAVVGFDHRIGHLKLFTRTRYGFGFVHDATGLQSLGNTEYTTIWQHFLGVTLYTPAFAIGQPYNSSKDFYLNAVFDKQRTWNSVPHYIDTTNTTVSLSRQLGPHVSSYVQYNVANTVDRYTNGVNAYPGSVPVVNGITYPGFAAFHGAATLRTLSLGAVYSNGGDFSFSLLVRKHTDFPAPIPQYFGFVPTNVLGQSLYTGYFGQPPYDVTGDVRMRLSRNFVLDVQRSYYFNYANLRWSPQFVFQVTQ